MEARRVYLKMAIQGMEHFAERQTISFRKNCLKIDIAMLCEPKIRN
jgi:hypothetical protein